MIEVQVLIPLISNEGESFSEEHHAAFEAAILGRFGGFSRLPGNVIGKWVGGGITYTDALIAYVIALPGLTDGGRLAEVIAFAKSHYKQEAIYLRYLGISEIL